MKINRFKVTFILLSMLASVALSGCSNEDNIESQPQEGMAKISFKINEKDYEAGEQVAGTRAAAPTKPELQDLPLMQAQQNPFSCLMAPTTSFVSTTRFLPTAHS